MGGRPSKPKTYQDHILPHSDELRELVADRLWLVEGSLPFPLPRNMVIYRLPTTGGLLVWSAIAVDDAMLAKIGALGKVEVLVIPSTHHSMDAAVFKERVAPAARVVCPASEKASLGGLATGTIETEVEAGVIKAGLVADGMPEGGELALVLDLGDSKAALVLCDLLFNILDTSDLGWFGKFVGTHIFGSIGPLHVTKFGKRFFVTDRKALAAWLTDKVRARIQDDLHLDLAVITVAHGVPLLEDCYAHLRLAAQRLLA